MNLSRLKQIQPEFIEAGEWFSRADDSFAGIENMGVFFIMEQIPQVKPFVKNGKIIVDSLLLGIQGIGNISLGIFGITNGFTTSFTALTDDSRAANETQFSDGEFLKFNLKVAIDGEEHAARLKFDKRFFTN